MKLAGYLILLILCFPIHAQTAKVIALSSIDAAEVKEAYAQRDAIYKRIDDLQKKIADKYLSNVKSGPGNNFITGSGFIVLSQTLCPETEADKKIRKDREEVEKKMTHLERKAGWEIFEFSDDFKFVVPKQTFTTPPSPPTGWINMTPVSIAN